MSDWTTGVCPGYRTKTLRHGNCTIVVHRPILSREETARQEKQVLAAVEATMKHYIERKEHPPT